MNILVIGSGGREHTLAWKIKQSSDCEQLYVMPGNAGTDKIALNINIPNSDFESIGQFVKDHEIGLVVVGPEAPLVEGIRDYFNRDDKLRKIPFIGPDKKGAMLEGSKDFAKNFMKQYGIPAAVSETFTAEALEDAKTYIKQQTLPVVLKADGLAAGKGVLICQTYEEALESIDKMLAGRMFGEASNKVVVEDFLDGIEVSVFVLSDGTDYVMFPEAKDYKRIGEQDTGPNTGGMGSVSPVNFADAKFLEKVEKRIVIPTINGLKSEGIDYKGFLFIGLMNMGGDPYVIEYNVRMGDPESQVVIPRIKNDFANLLTAAGKGELGKIAIEIDPSTAVTVVMAAGGYPGSYEKGKEISGLEDINGATVFHAGTRRDQGKTVTNGGRVLAVTATGDSLQAALENTYQQVAKIRWQDMQYRKDIGQDLLKLEK